MDDQLIECMVSASRPGRRQELIDGFEPGLRLRVGARSKTWSVLISGHEIRKVRIGLGTWPEVRVSAARVRARAVRLAYEHASQAGRARLCLGNLISAYSLEGVQGLRSERGVRQALDQGFAGTLHTYLWALSEADVKMAIARIAKRAPFQANRTLAYAKRMFAWGVERGFLRWNPAAAVSKPGTERARTRLLSGPELKRIWDAAEQIAIRTSGYPFGQVIRLMILSGARQGDVASMRLTDLDLASDVAIWRIRDSRDERPVRRVVDLSDEGRLAIEIALTFRPDGGSDRLFMTRSGNPISGWSATKRRLDTLLSYQTDHPPAAWRFDDIRRTHGAFIRSAAIPSEGHAAWLAWLKDVLRD